jgi:hypothetical protein
LPAPNLTFFGTFESPTEVGASVLIPPDDKPVIVRYGTYINGWRVVDISHHRLVLALGDRKTVFTLFDRTGPASEQVLPPPPLIGGRPFPPVTNVAPPAGPRSRAKP